MRIHYGNNNKKNNDQEENEALNIVPTQVDYDSGINNIQMKDNNSIIREDDDNDTNSIQNEVNDDDINNNNTTADADCANNIDNALNTYLTQTTVQKSSNNSINSPTII